MKRWHYIRDKCSIPCDEFLLAIRFVLNSTYFSFNNTFYQQTFGTPMGSPLSPIIADITMQDLEIRALEILPFVPLFFVRYVDDIAMSVPSSLKAATLNTFNSLHKRLQFTIEEGDDKRLNFLDTTICVVDECIEFDWYHKPTFSGRYLNFSSSHPACHKLGTIKCLTDRALLLSHPRCHRKNLRFVVDVLLDNGYPLPLIFQTIRGRLKTICKNQKSGSTNTINTHTSDTQNVKRFFNIPYIPNVSEKFRHVVQDLNLNLSYTGLHKLRCFIKVHKDPLPTLSRSNVVYKISCKDCNASYVGQTGRLLSTRINEHRKHINRNTKQLSVITEHRHSGHEFDWGGVDILDEEPFLYRRLISEMIFIKRQTNSLNAQNDTELLGDLYNLIIQELSQV
ncbi:PREDICTED: uncharacterized protein LOC105561048 [Vollenhovia emeryi]|uniref:uncharacterized protein LOC105561048 n=1 Tax=Vollenhovia emeryi TaxID=411798 RepID=UPI0005F48D6E|nr:PREDICTED: uncharacterized protein LOC105561048 [Vollenhovia emeryi]